MNLLHFLRSSPQSTSACPRLRLWLDTLRTLYDAEYYNGWWGIPTQLNQACTQSKATVEVHRGTCSMERQPPFTSAPDIDPAVETSLYKIPYAPSTELVSRAYVGHS